MRKYLRELHPTVFEDLIAMNALYRPGPMDYIPSFIARKNGREEIKYDIPCMEKYLIDTYGITVYQEQVMLLSRQLANFTRGESDALRKAMGKKKKAIVDAMKPKFIDGGKANGHDPKVLEKIWADWEKFASYAFNKSHATCYSWVAYQTGYLKAHYPAEYMAAVMSRSLSNITDITKLMDECKAMGIECLGPDVNESRIKFSVNSHGAIRFGLGAIKGMGDAASQNIIAEREKNGPFKDIYDLLQRVDLKACNRKAFECLALSGGLDSFGISREQYVAPDGNGNGSYLDTLVRYGQLFQQEQYQMKNSLFGGENEIEIAHPQPPQVEPWGLIEKLNRERDLVGIYLSAHPLDDYRIVLEKFCNTHCPELDDKEQLLDRAELTLGGIVTNIKEGYTKTNKPYLIVTIEDYEGAGEIVLFGEDSGKWRGMFIMGSAVFVTAKCSKKYESSKFVDFNIMDVQYLQTVLEKRINRITIRVNSNIIDDTWVNNIATMITDNPGRTEVYFQIHDVERNENINLYSTTKRTSVPRELIAFLDNVDGLSYEVN